MVTMRDELYQYTALCYAVCSIFLLAEFWTQPRLLWELGQYFDKKSHLLDTVLLQHADSVILKTNKLHSQSQYSVFLLVE